HLPFFLIIHPPPTSTLFPYTTLFRSRLIHRVVVAPRHLTFDLLADRQRVHEREPLLERDVHAVEPKLAAFCDFDRVHLRADRRRSEEHTSELQSPDHLVCRLLLEKKN